MKRFVSAGLSIALLLLLAVCLSDSWTFSRAAGPLDGPTPPPAVKEGRTTVPPEEITCLTFSMDGEDHRVVLNRPISASSKPEIRAAFVRVGQEMQLFGSEAEKLKGARLVQAILESDYTVGRVCYVYLARCAPECSGNGCATLRVPYPK